MASVAASLAAAAVALVSSRWARKATALSTAMADRATMISRAAGNSSRTLPRSPRERTAVLRGGQPGAVRVDDLGVPGGGGEAGAEPPEPRDADGGNPVAGLVAHRGAADEGGVERGHHQRTRVAARSPDGLAGGVVGQGEGVAVRRGFHE